MGADEDKLKRREDDVSIDDVSKSIGKMEGKIENLESANVTIFSKLDAILLEQTNQKISTTKLTLRVGLITAIMCFGVIEGVKYYFRQL